MRFRSFGKVNLNLKSDFKIPPADVGERTGDGCRLEMHLSDEDLVAARVENPHWKHFSGIEFLQHQMPLDPSSMMRWRKRLEGGLHGFPFTMPDS